VVVWGGAVVEMNLDLRLPRDDASVPMVRHLLDSSLGTLGVDAEIREDIQLMLTEACANVVRHARDGDDYTVRATIVDDRCVIRVMDTGPGFDPSKVAAVAPSAEHGRGLLIMKALADDVRFHSYAEHGALVALEKRLHFGAGAPRLVADGDGAAAG
jgi:serine/threonine-protein kinase RsbW